MELQKSPVNLRVGASYRPISHQSEPKFMLPLDAYPRLQAYNSFYARPRCSFIVLKTRSWFRRSLVVPAYVRDLIVLLYLGQMCRVVYPPLFL